MGRTLLSLIALLVCFCGCLCCGNLGGSDKTTTTLAAKDEMQCSQPYIRVGSSCCLDQNGNGICDTDETESTQAETQTTLGQETPSTIQGQAQTACSLDSDCTACASGCILHAELTSAPCPTPSVQCRCINENCVAQALPPTTTVASATTTLPSNQPTCFDGALNQGETIADCGGPCNSECIVTKLGGWQDFFGYKFRLKKADITEGNAKYTINIKTPDGREDERLVTTGESFVDHLRFKVIDYGEQNPRFYIKVNRADLQKVYAINPAATLLTIGGDACQGGLLWGTGSDSKLCTRRFSQYNITASRAESGVDLLVQKDGSAFTRYTLKGDNKLEFKGLVIGTMIDKEHYIVGGYTLLYMYTT